MKLSDLVEDVGTGQLSGSKIWGHVANAIASWACVYMVLYKSLDFGYVLAYLACVGTSTVASKFLSMRYGGAVAAAAEAAPAAPKVTP